jgi:E3 ubiquitin-protein ligase synoviolin
MLLTFYGLPIHIMRDLFMTARDFIKRLSALLRYRKAIQEMNRYPDATQEELTREDTCIICREEMRPWDPENNPGAMDRIRPKKLPCGHILHLGCLKSWLERQQVCPTCRSPVTLNENTRAAQNRAAGLGIQIGRGGRPVERQQPGNPFGQQNGGAQPEQRPAPPRVFNLGPFRVGFGANGQQVRELAQQFGMPQAAPNQQGPAPPTPGAGTPTVTGHTAPATPLPTGDHLQNAGNLLLQADQLIQRELQSALMAHQEVQTLQLLQAELQRLRQRHQNPDQAQNPQTHPIPPPILPLAQSLLHQPYPVPLQMQMQMPMPTNFPQFPGIPPRNPSPLMARHGAPPNAVPIPSGSSELPEGVVIPPGWSLLPLQRLDGSQASTQHSPQVGPQAAMADNISVAQSPFAARQPSPIGSRNQETQPAENASVPTSTEQRPLQFPTQLTRAVDPPQVVAPSPRLPNWGGSAQLFGSNSRLDQNEHGPQSELQTEANSSQSAPAEVIPQSSPAAEHTPQGSSPSHSEDDEEPESSSLKGKAKAVTVEDVEDEEDKDAIKED